MTSAAAFDCLKEWALKYVKHRDLAMKRIVGINDFCQGFIVENNDATSSVCMVRLSLKGFNPKEIADGQGKNTIIFTLSNDGNMQEVCKAWDILAQNRNLLIVFANPLSETEDKWVLKPHLHNRVCDRSSLLRGLKAMAELVEPMDEENLDRKIREHCSSGFLNE